MNIGESLRCKATEKKNESLPITMCPQIYPLKHMTDDARNVLIN